MKTNQYSLYTEFAIEYVAANFIAPKRILTKPEQQAIAIYGLLSDGEWHTAADVTVRIGIKSKRHIQNIMQALRVPFVIASGQQGYTIPNKSTILIA
jgi:hypothetical protein